MLIKIDNSNPVVLKSGGPIMQLNCKENNIGYVQYLDNEGNLLKCSFPLVCLYKCKVLNV